MTTDVIRLLYLRYWSLFATSRDSGARVMGSTAKAKNFNLWGAKMTQGCV